jgi:hypothetical protein
MRKCKIMKVAALQQVQYKVLWYGLYAPIETWVLHRAIAW